MRSSRALNQKWGFTLFEMIIASALLVTIMAGALALEYSNNQMFVAAKAEGELVTEIDTVISHINRELRVVRTGIAQLQITIDTATSEIKVLNATNGGLVARYYWNHPSYPNQLRYFQGGAPIDEIVSARLSSFSVSYPAPVSGKVPFFWVTIKTKASWGKILTKEVTVREVFGARLYQGLTIKVS